MLSCLNPWKRNPQPIDPVMIKKLLPIGGTEFETWAENIIHITGLTASVESQKHTLAAMITTLGKTESAVEDLFFIKSLHKAAANEVAVAKMDEIQKAFRAKKLAEQEAAKLAVTPVQPQSDVTPIPGAHDVLAKS